MFFLPTVHALQYAAGRCHATDSTGMNFRFVFSRFVAKFHAYRYLFLCDGSFQTYIVRLFNSSCSAAVSYASFYVTSLHLCMCREAFLTRVVYEIVHSPNFLDSPSSKNNNYNNINAQQLNSRSTRC